MPYELPPLPYPYDALLPYIDARTFEFHHDKHHQTYVNNLNKVLADQPDIAAKPIEQVLADISKVPQNIRQGVINHGGGHANHSLFWQIMGPAKGGEPAGEIGKAIKEAFGSFATFKEKLAAAAVNQFGSGWGWLAVDPQGKLTVMGTLNQDSPLSMGHRPILVVDVWEHAYYLQYQNRRADWVNAWWNVVAWDKVDELYRQAKRR